MIFFQIEKFIVKRYHYNMNKTGAVALFNKGFNCAQSILATYGLDSGLNQDTALKIASVFGGGIGRMGETCGAVTGAFMVIGLKCGTTKPDAKTKIKAYELGGKFIKKFRARNNSILCGELLGFQIASDRKLKPGERGIIKLKCPKYVKDAAEIIEELLLSVKRG